MSDGKKAALIVFVKNPKKGKVKTRLAEEIGEQEALDVYLRLLDHTQNISGRVSVPTHIFYSDFIEKKDIWSELDYFKHQQTGQDLGDRMYNAFKKIFGLNYQKVIIIGSDCLELQTEHINKAFWFLNRYDAVIGPARDGGYYLLGMNRLISEVFKNKTWSTSSVFDDTIKDFRANSITWQELPVLNDVDVVKDLER